MFEQSKEAKEQILRDKHTLLEGYVTEYLFEKQFLTEKDKSYTNGWWSALRGKKRFFFLVKEEPNDLDEKVFRLLNSRYTCWRAYPEKEEWFFSDGQSKISEKEFLTRYGFKAIHNHLSATNEIKDSQRQNQCIEFFENHNIMTKIAIERNFADDFLTVYFNNSVNMDYIIMNAGGHLCVMEIKFKYENKAGYFGINTGQVQMFEKLEELGFEIHHMILYNQTKNKDLSIFGFLNKKSLKKYWLYSKLTDFSNREKSTAPEATSVDGKRRQAYYLFGMNEISKKCLLKQ